MPPVKVDPARFTDKTFMRRATWEDAVNDCRVMIDGLTAGRIRLSEFAESVTRWTWIITGPYIPPKLEPSHGDEDTLEAAQEAFKVKFWQWHRWALNQPGGVSWID
jgi:hypothetical protein